MPTMPPNNSYSLGAVATCIISDNHEQIIFVRLCNCIAPQKRPYVYMYSICSANLVDIDVRVYHATKKLCPISLL